MRNINDALDICERTLKYAAATHSPHPMERESKRGDSFYLLS
jgi:hypothetical protein